MSKTNSFRWRMLLLPFSFLYALVIWVRNSLFDNGILRSESFNVPLIGIGNITVGGTGKTPHVEYLVELLGEGYRVATLSRGYMRKSRDFRIASIDSAVAEIGDEPLQVKHRFPGITVAVDRDRVNGVSQLLKLAPPIEAILLDDAYQHRSIKPGYSILLMDYNRPNDKDLMLPAGNLREPAANRSRANMILVTRSPERLRPIEMREFVKNLELTHGQHLFFTNMRFGELNPVYPGIEKHDASWFKEKVKGILIVSGIANPRTIRQYARSISTNISELSFPDHHNYTGKNLARITESFYSLKAKYGDILVLTTEKDAVRLAENQLDTELREALHAVRIHVNFLNNDQEAFNHQILNYVSSNKRSSVLYQEEHSGDS